jgi:molecular chaperone DnaK
LNARLCHHHGISHGFHHLFQSVKITAGSGLSEADIQRMVKEAETNADEDKKKKEKVSVKNNLDSLVYNTEKLLKENGDKVSAPIKTEIEAAVADAKSALSKDEVESMKTALEKLNQISHKMAEEMYKASGAAGQPGGGGSQGNPGNADAKKEDEPIEAEFREEKGN